MALRDRLLPEQVRDRQHHHADGDRLQQPEAGEPQRPVADLVEAVVDLDAEDAPKQVEPEPNRPEEHEQRGRELHPLARSGEREHDRKQREGEAVGEVGDHVRLADCCDREEGAVDASEIRNESRIELIRGA